MSTVYVSDKKSLLKEIEQLQPGDCVQIECFSAVAGSAKEMVSLLQKIFVKEADLVSLQEGIDSRGEQKAGLLALCQALYSLDRSELRKKQQRGIEQAREDGKYKGRKPIAVDDELFEAVIKSWQGGEITARQAMAQLELKPNTFYRRIKDREEQKMKEYRKAGQASRSEIKEAAKQSRRELDAIKKQVKAEAKELKKQAAES